MSDRSRGRWLRVIVAVGIVAVGIGAVAAARGGGGADRGVAGPGPTAVAVGSGPRDPVAPAAAVPASSSAVPPPATAPPLPASGTAAVVAPSAESFATGADQPPAGVPSVVAAPDSDGCDRDYGTPTQCVPSRAPGGGPVTCAFLVAYGLLPLRVNLDHLGLTTAPGARTTTVDGALQLVGCTP